MIITARINTTPESKDDGVDSPTVCCDSLFSNQGLLIATTILFALFVIAEVVGGLAANSLSLLGDAAAMSIDVFTYGSNLYAECLKESELSPMKKVLSQVAIPVFSLTCLMAITIWVAIDAYLRLRRHKEVTVRLNLMYIFAAINFCVDVSCVMLFLWRRNGVFGEKKCGTAPVSQDGDDDWSCHEESEHGISMTEIHAVENMKLVRGNRSDRTDSEAVMKDEPNLNMLSAMTHVAGDTLRTVAIFVASGVSSFFNIDPQITDAWASIVVSITIIVAVTPLIFSVKNSIQIMWA